MRIFRYSYIPEPCQHPPITPTTPIMRVRPDQDTIRAAQERERNSQNLLDLGHPIQLREDTGLYLHVETPEINESARGSLVCSTIMAHVLWLSSVSVVGDVNPAAEPPDSSSRPPMVCQNTLCVCPSRHQIPRSRLHHLMATNLKSRISLGGPVHFLGMGPDVLGSDTHTRWPRLAVTDKVFGLLVVSELHTSENMYTAHRNQDSSPMWVSHLSITTARCLAWSWFWWTMIN